MADADGQSRIRKKNKTDEEYRERQYGHSLTDAEVEEIRTNLLNLAELLMELARSETGAEWSEPGGSSKGANGDIARMRDPGPLIAVHSAPDLLASWRTRYPLLWPVMVIRVSVLMSPPN